MEHLLFYLTIKCTFSYEWLTFGLHSECGNLSESYQEILTDVNLVK